MVSYKRFLFTLLATQALCVVLALGFWCGLMGKVEWLWLARVQAGYAECMQTVEEKHARVRFPLITSPASKRKYIAGVTTMRKTMNSKLPRFRRIWEEVWPGIEFRVSVGFRNSDTLQGLGSLASIYRLCSDALANKDDFDYLIIFEDDAEPHANTSWPKDLDRVLDALDKEDGSGIMLGAHQIWGYDKGVLRKKVKKDGLSIVKARGAFGSYGMAIPKKYLVELACRYESALQKKYRERVVPDQENWLLWNNLGGGGYVAAPLLVDHSQYAYSFTWKKFRKFVMRRDFWNEAG